MSWQATSWALEQDVASPSEMVTLLAICNYADFDGKCWPSQELLAKQTKQSVDSIQRRFRDLERRRLIYRVRQRRKNDGRNNGEWTTGLIVVMMDSICLKEAMQHGFDPNEAVGSAYENENLQNQELSNDAGPQIAVRQEVDPNENNGLDGDGDGSHTANCGAADDARHAAKCGASRTALVRYGIVKNEYNIPPSPPKTPGASERDDHSWVADWKRFEDVWPWTDKDAPHRVREKIRHMTPEDRDDLIHAAEAYLVDCRMKRKIAASARGFVNGLWRDWVFAGRKLSGKPQRKIGEPVFVRKGSDAWLAWLSARGVRSLPTVRKTIDEQSIEGWMFPTLFPPPAGIGEAQASPG